MKEQRQGRIRVFSWYAYTEVGNTMGVRITVAKMGKRQFEGCEHFCLHILCFTDLGMTYTMWKMGYF